VLGAIFHVEVEVSACDELLFLEIFPDESSDPLLTTEVSESGSSVIEPVPGYPLTIDLTLERMDYSMLIAVSI
jgi:hypothetical protein